MTNLPGSRPSWDATWLRVAEQIALRSLCTRDKVGAVIVDRSFRIVSSGYNGPPSGFIHKGRFCSTWCQRATKDGQTDPGYTDCPSLHAEANALMVCDRREREGGTIFITSHVCYTCAKLIANSGLDAVCLWDSTLKTIGDYSHRDPLRSYNFLETCGIDVVGIPGVRNSSAS